MKSLTLAVMAGIAFLLFGCLQSSPPSACSGVSADRFANCIYVSAVLEQNPLYCYSLNDTYQRTICLQDSTNSEKKSALEKADQATRDAIFSPTPIRPPPPTSNNTTANASTQQPAPPVPPTTGCKDLEGIEKDNCYQLLAIERNEIGVCEEIVASGVRETCIFQIAYTNKNPQMCSKLTRQSSIDLCNFYSSGK